MSYEPTEWKAGDTVTSAKLNKIEDGIAAAYDGGGSVLVIHQVEGTLDKTWKEIHDALANGTIVVLPGSDETGAYLSIVNEASVDEGTYDIYVFGSAFLSFTTDSENGYPIIAQSGPMPNPSDLDPGAGSGEIVK